MEYVLAPAGALYAAALWFLFRRTHDPTWNARCQGISRNRRRAISSAVGAGPLGRAWIRLAYGAFVVVSVATWLVTLPLQRRQRRSRALNAQLLHG